MYSCFLLMFWNNCISFPFEECDTLVMSIFVKFINSFRSSMTVHDHILSVPLDFFFSYSSYVW